MKNFIRTSAFLTLALLMVSPVFAVIHNVPADFGTIQAGLNAAASTDTVLVQPGTYVENINWPQVAGINLIAAGDTSNTIIDGDGTGRVITIMGGGFVDSTSVIEGFTIQNGVPSMDGGAIICTQGGLTVNRCNIRENESSNTSWIYISESSLQIFDSSIMNNTALGTCYGIFSLESSLSMDNVVIRDNTCYYMVYFTNLSGVPCTITDCEVQENEVGQAIFWFQYGAGTLSGCNISDNAAALNTILVTQTNDLTIENCTLADNMETYGIRCYDSNNIVVKNCTVTNYGRGIQIDSGTTDVLYCDFYANSVFNYLNAGGNPGVGDLVTINANSDSCDVFYNIFLDPEYVDPDNGDFNLMAGSPCIDAGDPTSPSDPDGTVADIGALYYHQEPYPVTVTLTPTASTTIPAAGGTLYFDVTIVSNLLQNWGVWFYTTARGPNGTLLPFNLFQYPFNMAAGQTYNGSLTQNIPAIAPPGTYTLYGIIGLNPNRTGPTVSDSFQFTKIDTTVHGAYEFDPVDWQNGGAISLLTNDLAEGEMSTANLPSEFVLGRAYPNPFNAMTTVSVVLPDATDLTVTVFNTVGQEVVQLANGRMAAGRHTLTFDASNLSSGVYFIQATVPGKLDALQKVALVK